MIIHILLFLIGISISSVCLFWVLKNPNRHGAAEFIIFLIVIIMWSIVQIGEILTSNVTTAIFLTFLNEGLRVMMVISWMYFAVTYAGYGKYIHKKEVSVILAAVFTYILVFTSVPPVVLSYSVEGFIVSDSPFTNVDFGEKMLPMYIAQGLGYAVVVFGTAPFVYKIYQAKYTKNWHIIAATLTVFFVIAVDLVNNLPFIIIVPGIDYTAFSVTSAVSLFIYITYRYDIFGYTPVTRGHIVEELDDPVIAINPKKQIIDYNEAAEDVFEVTLQTGIHINNFLPEEVSENEYIADYKEGNDVIKLQDYETKYYDVNITKIDHIEKPAGLVIIFRDITEITEKTHQLERQTEQLEEFTSIVSHDLRNPLTVAYTYIEDEKQDNDSENIKTIKQSLERMNDIIDDALVMAREGRAIKQKEWVDLEGLINSAWTNTGQEKSGVKLVTENISDTELMTDYSRLQTVFENLFRNSIEHNNNEVVITVGADVENAVISINDNGEGFDDVSKVFEKGYTTSQSGTGFGLSIVKSIIDAHKWSIIVTNNDGGGARIEFKNVDIRYTEGK